MAEIQPLGLLDRTRFATGEGKSASPDRRQIGIHVTVEQFTRIKDEAIRQGTSMSEIMRQLIDLL